MPNIPTPHIEASSKDEIASVVLMPGDPLRAKKIAEGYLEDVKQFNHVRGMLGFTGTYKGKRVSVMGSGMGFGSIGIYSYELYRFYDVATIIRIGSCGALHPELDIMDIVLVDGSFSTETFARDAHGIADTLIQGSPRISEIVRQVAAEKGISLHEGNVVSDNVFYTTADTDWSAPYAENKVIASEMESFALFANARAVRKEAACLLTVSDSSFHKGEELSAQARQNAFGDMMLLALETAIASMK
ncbi:MAG: purine-nucleoside phosphorylase [Chloroflexi bacterium]|nr:purine-nucleoside phosphorylase [Chloroflexota bacterium]RJR10227.1 MAG: purine-nucleoside phosphorylase [Candidatus Parcubacteria bacterium]